VVGEPGLPGGRAHHRHARRRRGRGDCAPRRAQLPRRPECLRLHRARHRHGAFADWAGTARIVHDDRGPYFVFTLG